MQCPLITSHPLTNSNSFALLNYDGSNEIERAHCLLFSELSK
jgi:hypothetical protein